MDWKNRAGAAQPKKWIEGWEMVVLGLWVLGCNGPQESESDGSVIDTETIVVAPCVGKQLGDNCHEPGEGDGIYVEEKLEELTCRPAQPCDNRQVGDPCLGPWGSGGICLETDQGELFCQFRNPCEGKGDGDGCREWYTQETVPELLPGICTDNLGGGFYCQPYAPCQGAIENGPCSTFVGQADGTCVLEKGGSALYCKPENLCWEQPSGAPCENPFVPGDAVCAMSDTGLPYCELERPCEDKIEGDSCFSTYGHGLKWGTGKHGWNASSIYLPQPYDENTVVEINIGVPSRRK